MTEFTNVHGFNTGRLYQSDGQRISYAQINAEVLFNDHSRGISGRFDCDLPDNPTPRQILAAYDRGDFVYDLRADEIKAAAWPRM